MKLFHLTSDWDFEGANLCSNSGVYSSREKAIEVFSRSDCVALTHHYHSSLEEMMDEGQLTIEEIDIE